MKIYKLSYKIQIVTNERYKSIYIRKVKNKEANRRWGQTGRVKNAA